MGSKASRPVTPASARARNDGGTPPSTVERERDRQRKPVVAARIAPKHRPVPGYAPGDPVPNIRLTNSLTSMQSSSSAAAAPASQQARGSAPGPKKKAADSKSQWGNLAQSVVRSPAAAAAAPPPVPPAASLREAGEAAATTTTNVATTRPVEFTPVQPVFETHSSMSRQQQQQQQQQQEQPNSARSKRSEERLRPDSRGSVLSGSGNPTQFRGDGFERHVFENGDTYIGEWKNGMMHNNGSYLYARTGNTYVGEYKAHKKHGFGVFTVKETGSVYSGEWRNGVKHGVGCQTDGNGTTYEGDFADGLRCGRGTVTLLPSNDRFDGAFLDDAIAGFGELFLANGTKCVVHPVPTISYLNLIIPIFHLSYIYICDV
eukprot:TRINITY_DN2544_c1_g1_i1.p1 TRINITY_DN2544_c1_g1~~TRINITY_DN2544_c1_g1_i1.p1  ORF type:complete len:374 (-),score=53.93 TRINITY_DN2544_c1_g1_i1:13-1134(-)